LIAVKRQLEQLYLYLLIDWNLTVTGVVIAILIDWMELSVNLSSYCYIYWLIGA